MIFWPSVDRINSISNRAALGCEAFFKTLIVFGEVIIGGIFSHWIGAPFAALMVE
jgi:hypothetical protein